MAMPEIRKKYWILVGTRPEAIKQAPLFKSFVERFGADQVALIGTGQHRELLEQALAHFSLRLDHNLDIMEPDQSLTAASVAVLKGMDGLFRQHRPEWLVVQGDTTSAAMAGWAAFQHGVKVAHNEAGLRSYDLAHPFPEEANRRLLSVVAAIHLAPTERAREALLREGVKPEKIPVVGNTGIDALRYTLGLPTPPRAAGILADCAQAGLQPVLLTAHRRENQGEGMDRWFKALAQFLVKHPHVALIYPCHPNNSARAAADQHLAPLKQVFILPALDYGETCHLLARCWFVVTDSGGIQEEAATLGVPVVVCRKTTERMEAVDAGLARLAGTETESVLKVMEWAHAKGPAEAQERHLATAPSLRNPIFGDGYSSARITQLIANESPVPRPLINP
jgi:UDP-N-acetylglucosamine 2-epimerase (non-hydrolysing)